MLKPLNDCEHSTDNIAHIDITTFWHNQFLIISAWNSTDKNSAIFDYKSGLSDSTNI